MAEFPALSLWTDAYLADTRHLSTVEHGAYLLLLMEAWRRPNCDLPDDDKILARLAGLPEQEWTTIKDAILAFWNYDGRSKTYRQKRLLKERDLSRKRSKSQADKASKRWKQTKEGNAAAYSGLCPADASTTTTTTTTIEEEEPVVEPTVDARENSNGKRPYAFQGETIRLNQADLAQWQKSFHAIPDIQAELRSIDIWLQGESVPEAKRKNWFAGVSGLLNRKHQEWLAKAEAEQSTGMEFTSPC